MVARSVSVEADLSKDTPSQSVQYDGLRLQICSSSMAEVADFVQSGSTVATQMFARASRLSGMSGSR
jgi:hypothetical protein